MKMKPYFISVLALSFALLGSCGASKNVPADLPEESGSRQDSSSFSEETSQEEAEELEEFLPQVTITPALVQNEIHPYYQENDVIPYIHQLGIAVQGWYPLGGRGHTQELLNDETIAAIGEAYNRSAAQVILRWNLQKGVVVIPGSSNPDHIKENISLFDFELTQEEMERINALDRNEKHDWY